MKILSLAVLALAFLFTSCERHTWEDNDANGDGIISESEKGTKRLYEAHGDHGGGGHDGEGGHGGAEDGGH